MLVLNGDALEVRPCWCRGSTRGDFSLLHPGGKLGRRLVRVDEVMHD